MKRTPIANAAAQATKQAAQKDQHVAYPLGFVNAIAQFLAEQPYKQVAGLIEGIQKYGVPVELPAPADPPAADK